MKLALFGYGGHAREVMCQIGESLPCFISDDYYTGQENTYPLSKFDPLEYKIMIAIGDTKHREKVTKLLPKETTYFSFIHPTALIMDKNIKIGDGSFIGAYSILTTNINIGKHSLLNRCVNIGHDCIIGDFFSAMPNSVISGNVTIGSNFYIGNNASVKEGIEIIDNVIVGMNGCVVKNILDPGTYVGVPVKKIK